LVTTKKWGGFLQKKWQRGGLDVPGDRQGLEKTEKAGQGEVTAVVVTIVGQSEIRSLLTRHKT